MLKVTRTTLSSSSLTCQAQLVHVYIIYIPLGLPSVNEQFGQLSGQSNQANKTKKANTQVTSYLPIDLAKGLSPRLFLQAFRYAHELPYYMRFLSDTIELFKRSPGYWQ